MAFPPHIYLAVKMLPHLVECAKTGRQTTYKELSVAVNVKTGQFHRSLAFIRDQICDRHKLPPLTALIQYPAKETYQNSFDPERWSNLNPTEYNEYKDQMLQKVYAYEKWDMALTGLQAMYHTA